MTSSNQHLQSASNLRTKLFISFVLMSLLASGILTFALYESFRSRLRDGIRERLGNVAAVAALQIDPVLHDSLTDPADEGNSTYRKLQTRMQAIQAAATDIRYLYTMRKGPGGEIRFVVDAEIDPDRIAHLNEVYDEPGEALAREFSTMAAPLVEDDFYTDKFGTQLSGYAPFMGPDGQRAGVIGVDIAADKVIASEHRFLFIALAVFLAIVPFLLLAAWLLSRRLTGVAIRTMEALRQQHQQLELVMEGSQIGWWDWNITTGDEIYNEILPELLGYELNEIEPHISWWEDKIHPEDAEQVGADLQKHFDGETGVYINTHRLQTKSGEWQWFTDHGKVIERDSDGKPLRMLGSLRNVNARKQAEEERLSLERQVRHAQKLESLGVLAGGIAHDFNNILMAILGNADLALNALPPHAPARDNIVAIERSSKRAAELAGQMLAYSGKGRFVIEPIQLNDVVEEMAHLLDVSISKKAVLKYNFSGNLPTFDGDTTQIRQIIMNLITNASESMGNKSGVIALSTGEMDCDREYLDCGNVLCPDPDEELPEGVYIYFEVADTGCGMDKETIEKVFDPFFTTKFTGRGLGMSAVMGIVRGHKGAIKINSHVDRGTTFKVLFPANDISEHHKPAQGKASTENDDWCGKGTILIADDEESICDVGKQMLELMGFDVLTAPDGREALEVFREHLDEIVCVLLDLTMPHLDGEQTFRELRRMNPEIKVVLCSGYNEHEATQRFAGKGLAGFLQKPFNMAALKKGLQDVLIAGRW